MSPLLPWSLDVTPYIPHSLTPLTLLILLTLLTFLQEEIEEFLQNKVEEMIVQASTNDQPYLP
jgi:hypothetical protein